MLLRSQRTGNIMAHTHHIPALIVQAHHRRFIPSALRVQRRGLFLGVSDAPGVFTVPQLKPGTQHRWVIYSTANATLQCWGFSLCPENALALAIPRSKAVRTGTYGVPVTSGQRG